MKNFTCRQKGINKKETQFHYDTDNCIRVKTHHFVYLNLQKNAYEKMKIFHYLSKVQFIYFHM